MYLQSPELKSQRQHYKVSNHLCLVSLTWYDTWSYQTSNKTLVLSVTLPTVRTHCALRDAPFGSVLFLSAIPVLPPPVGFPASCPPLCLLLIKHAPVGRRGEGGGRRTGGFLRARWRCYIPPCFCLESETCRSRGAALAQLHLLHHVMHFLSYVQYALPV